MARPKKYIISLSETDVNKLQTIIHKKDTSKSIIRRCQILLELDENTPSHLTQMQIANAFGVCKATVSNIVKHYIEQRDDACVTYKRNPNSNASARLTAGMKHVSLSWLVQSPLKVGPDGPCVSWRKSQGWFLIHP